MPRKSAKNADPDNPHERQEPARGLPTSADSFPPQWAYVTTTSKRNTVLCSRRAGKTAGELMRAELALTDAKNVLYVGKVRRNVREQFFLPLKTAFGARGAPFAAQEMDFVLRPDAGGFFMGMSADDIRDIEKGRGYRWDLAIVDEAQSFPDAVLEPLIDLIIIPTLIDTSGTLDLVGTAPDALSGYFVKAIKSEDWSHFSWSIWDNPRIPRENVIEAYRARGIGPGHNVWEREVEGRLVANLDARVYPFDPARNRFARLPE